MGEKEIMLPAPAAAISNARNEQQNINFLHIFLRGREEGSFLTPSLPSENRRRISRGGGGEFCVVLGNCGEWTDSSNTGNAPSNEGVGEEGKEGRGAGNSTKYPRATDFNFPQPQQIKLALTHTVNGFFFKFESKYWRILAASQLLPSFS